MDIYIGNLPSQLGPAELKKVVNSVLLPNSFREFVRRLVSKNEKLTFSEFDVIESQIEGNTIRFAHGVIMPDSVGRRLLQRMDHLTFKGKSLCVREYTTRSESNDRRRKKPQNLYAVKSYNRRHKDRRLRLDH